MGRRKQGRGTRNRRPHRSAVDLEGGTSAPWTCTPHAKVGLLPTSRTESDFHSGPTMCQTGELGLLPNASEPQCPSKRQTTLSPSCGDLHGNHRLKAAAVHAWCPWHAERCGRCGAHAPGTPGTSRTAPWAGSSRRPGSLCPGHRGTAGTQRPAGSM